VSSLNKLVSTRATPIINSTNNINNATSIPTRLVDNNKNINDNNYISGADNFTPRGENSQGRRTLRKRVIPKTQKHELNTIVYKIFEDKIHQGNICRFDPKEGYYTINLPNVKLDQQYNYCQVAMQCYQ
jgi:hypothetical protein